MVTHAIVETRGVKGTAEASLDTVFVDSPHAVDALVDVGAPGVTGDHGGHEEPESDVVSSQLEQG